MSRRIAEKYHHGRIGTRHVCNIGPPAPGFNLRSTSVARMSLVRTHVRLRSSVARISLLVRPSPRHRLVRMPVPPIAPRVACPIASGSDAASSAHLCPECPACRLSDRSWPGRRLVRTFVPRTHLVWSTMPLMHARVFGNCASFYRQLDQ